MADKQQPSTKRALIDKANTSVVVITSIAAFVVIFSLVASKALISQAAYQNRVIGAEKKTLTRIKSDLNATGSLRSSYNAFTSTTNNIIGGLSNGTGPQDGNNADIILDALPSSYDFPALTNSLEALLTSAGVQINSISGTDDEVAQSANASSVAPQSVAMPFQISVTGDYASIQKLVDEFEHSIRPFQIQTLQISGDQTQLTLNISAQTFYQPAKTLNVQTEVIK
jgi:hypothetical protein